MDEIDVTNPLDIQKHQLSYLSNSSTNSNTPITSPGIELSMKTRMIVYALFLISNILNSMDHGSIPASTLQLRQLTSHDQSIGLFGSLVYVGNIIGSLFICCNDSISGVSTICIRINSLLALLIVS